MKALFMTLLGAFTEMQIKIYVYIHKFLKQNFKDNATNILLVIC